MEFNNYHTFNSYIMKIHEEIFQNEDALCTLNPEVREVLESAWAAIKNGEIETAVKLFESIVDEDNEYMYIRISLAIGYILYINNRKGINLLKNVLKQQPDNSKALVLSTFACMEERWYKKAADAIDMALILEPEEALLYLGSAEIQFVLGNKQRVAAVLKEGINRVSLKDAQYMSLYIMLMDIMIVTDVEGNMGDLVEQTLDHIIKTIDDFDMDKDEIVDMLRNFAEDLCLNDLFYPAIIICEKLLLMTPGDAELVKRCEEIRYEIRMEELLDILDDIDDLDDDLWTLLSILIERPYRKYNPQYPEAMRTLVEYNILCKAPGIFGHIRELEAKYPELYALAAPFFIKIFNLNKHQKMVSEYEKRLEKYHDLLDDIQKILEDKDDYFDWFNNNYGFDDDDDQLDYDMDELDDAFFNNEDWNFEYSDNKVIPFRTNK